MNRVIPFLILLGAGLPLSALADDTEECEVELHDDGFIEIEYENEAAGIECEVVIPVGTVPNADEQACIDLCQALLNVAAVESITAGDLCQALAEMRVDAGVIATLPDGTTQTVQAFCAGPGGQAGGSIIVIVPGGSITTRR